jgi:hypothetical protein
MKLMTKRPEVYTSTKPVKYLPIFLQMAFSLTGLFVANELAIYLWRAMTGH